jgi:branched-chain amino acid transport system permease protein
MNLTDLTMWLIAAVILTFIITGSIATLAAGHYTSRVWLDFVVSGLAQGSIYGLIALGYTMVYGILRMVNFAHSEVFMSGPFTAYFVATALKDVGWLNQYPLMSLSIVFIAATVTSTLVAVLLERIAYRPLRNAPRLVPLITAIGASLFLQYTFRGLFGVGIKAYPEVEILQGEWFFGGLRILRVQAMVILAATSMMVGLYLFVQHTRTGKAMRAVSEDKAVASLVGINIDRIVVTTFVIGGMFAGVAGVLYALMFSQVHFFMGFVPGIKAFTAAALGGVGNIPGAMVGGIFLGLFESVGTILFLDGLGVPAPYQLKDAIVFTLLVLVLILRPTGILGERLAQKKA